MNKWSIMSRNEISALLALISLICCMTTGHVSAGKPIRTASSGDTFPKPKVNSAPDVEETRESDLLSAKTCDDRGVIYSENGQYDLVISEFTKALEIIP